MSALNNAQILQILKNIESSNGQNINHPIIRSGLDKGTHAMGNWGLTSSTINDVVKHNPQYQNLQQQNPDEKRQFIENNPVDEYNIANQLVNRLQTRYANDPDKIAYSWNHGTYINPEKITQELEDQDAYVQKFRALRNMLMPQPQLTKTNEENQ